MNQTDNGMNIYGLQKLTLLDYPGKTACTVFTGGCNLRCPFCHNGSLVRKTFQNIISEKEFLSFLENRNGLLDGVAITGGEPLLNEGIFDFICKVKKLGFLVKLDTNGTIPNMLKHIVDGKLVDYIAMDIKNSPDKYSMTCGVGFNAFNNAKQSIDILMGGDIDYEFRTTVVKGLHDGNDFADIARIISGCKRYFLQKFVDSGDILYRDAKFSAPSDEEMNEYLEITRRYGINSFPRGF